MKLPRTEFVWLLGDTYRLPEHTLEYVLSVLESQTYAAMVTNLSRKLSIGPHAYTGVSELLSDVCSVISRLSFLMHYRDLIAAALFSRYYESYFINTSTLLEYIADKKASVYWAVIFLCWVLPLAIFRKPVGSTHPQMSRIGVGGGATFFTSSPLRTFGKTQSRAQLWFAELTRELHYARCALTVYLL